MSVAERLLRALQSLGRLPVTHSACNTTWCERDKGVYGGVGRSGVQSPIETGVDGRPELRVKAVRVRGPFVTMACPSSR